MPLPCGVGLPFSFHRALECLGIEKVKIEGSSNGLG